MVKVGKLARKRLYEERIRSLRLIAISHFIFFTIISFFYFLAPSAEEIEANSGLLRPVELSLLLYGLLVISRLVLSYKKVSNLILSHFLIASDFLFLSAIVYSFHIEYMQPITLSLKSPTFAFYFLYLVINGLHYEINLLVASGFWAVVSWTSMTLMGYFSSRVDLTHSYVDYIFGSQMLLGAEIEKIIALAFTSSIIVLSATRSARVYSKTVEEVSDSLDEIEKRKSDLDIANENLQDALRVKTNFMTKISHELRTPLNIIIGRINEAKAVHPDLMKNSVSLLEMVDNIITLNEIKSPDLKKEKFNLKDVIDDATSFFKGQLPEEIELIKHLNTGTEDVYFGHKLYVKRVFGVLFSNAVKYTEKGHITIGTSYNAKEGTLHINFMDSGKGISEDIINKFSVLDIGEASGSEGLGLGLVTLRSIVEFLDGKVHVSAQENIGTTFYISFPIQRLSSQKAELIRPNTEVDFKVNPLKVLIVDDNDSNLLIFKVMLQKEGCICQTALNGKEAIEKVERDVFDVVLMDCMMPVMNGYEASKYIRANISRELPIIALTAHALQKDREKALESGMNEHLTKPINRAELIKIIRKFASVYRTDKDENAKKAS